MQALRRQLFEEEVTAPANAKGVAFFSASGEALECIDIARRILASELSFDSRAVLLRSPGTSSALTEDAFRRAGIAAWFTRGSVRPDSAGRSFLALLLCAEEGLTASRFGEYLSHEQKEYLYGWEKLLVDASVIGGCDRWKRPLDGLHAGLQDRLSEAKHKPDRKRVAWQSDRLEKLAEFALPLIERLQALRAPRGWGEWLDGLLFFGSGHFCNWQTMCQQSASSRGVQYTGPPRHRLRGVAEGYDSHGHQRERKNNRLDQLYVANKLTFIADTPSDRIMTLRLDTDTVVHRASIRCLQPR